MQKTILITGSTDGIGLETAKMLVSAGHKVLLHGRNSTKLEEVEKSLSADGGCVETYVADLSCMADVEVLTKAVTEKHTKLNDSGQFSSPHPDALNPQKSEEIVGAIEAILDEVAQSA